jgi:hypothetical protein
MGKGYVKGGTPIGSASLCETCSYAHVMTGYRESEKVSLCSYPDPYIVVPFNIHECTRYYDKNRPSWEEMKKLAIHVDTGPIKPVGFKVGVGFNQPTVPCKVGGDDDDFDEDDD